MKKQFNILNILRLIIVSILGLAIIIFFEVSIHNQCIDQINTSLDNVCHTTYTVQGDGKTVIEDLINATPDTINSILSAIGCSIFLGGSVFGIGYKYLQCMYGKDSVVMKILDETLDFANGLLGVFALIATYITLITNVSHLTINSVQSEIIIPAFDFSLYLFNAITGRFFIRILDAILDAIMDMLEEQKGGVYAMLASAIGLICAINFYCYHYH